jgi:hypothetical protein
VKKSTGKPTKAQQDRFVRLRNIGCIACRKRGFLCVVPEIHHCNLDGKAGQKRRGHDFTLPLCGWHHQGKPGPLWSAKFTKDLLGPSLKLQSRAFRQEFGTDDELLAEVNAMLAA